MTDEEQRDPVPLEVSDDIMQALEFSPRNSRCWLVENKHSRFEGERPRDLNRLTFGDGQHFKRQMNVDSQLQPLEQLSRARRHSPPVHRSAPLGLPPNKDVFGDRQIGEQRRVLMDDSYAVTLCFGCVGQGYFLAVLEDVALIRLMDAREDLYESRLSGAIFPGKRMDLAGFESKVNVAQNLDRSKALADAAKLDNRHHAQPPTQEGVKFSFGTGVCFLLDAGKSPPRI